MQIFTIEHRKKLSLAALGKKKPWLKGKHASLKTEFKKGVVSFFKKHPEYIKKGSEHYMWKKDRNLLKKYDRRNDMAYRDWRRNVWLRDNFKCRMVNNDCNGRLETHHILGWASFPELRYEVNNGITLCKFHHPRKRVDEKNLAPIFQKLVES